MKNAFNESRKHTGELNAQIEDNLLGIRVVKSFGNEEIEIEKFQEGNKNFVEAKKLSYKNFQKIRGTVTAIKLSDDDELVSVDVLYGKKDIIIYTREGGGIRISTDDIRECGRAAYGLSIIDLAGGDEVLGTTIINKNHKYMLIVTNKGKMKKCTLSTFKTMKRKSPTLQLTRLEKNEVIVSVKSVKESDQFMVYTQHMEHEMKVKEIAELTRQHPCKKMIGVKTGDKVIDVVVK